MTAEREYKMEPFCTRCGRTLAKEPEIEAAARESWAASSRRSPRTLGLDIDGVLADFARGVLRVAGIPLERYRDIEEYSFLPVLDFGIEVWPRIKGDWNFWLSLQPLENAIPACCSVYLTSRACPEEVTRTWLRVHGFPELPIVNTEDKAGALGELLLDGLVDDQDKHFLAAQAVSTDNFLVSRPWNRKVATSKRIYRLEELEWRL